MQHVERSNRHLRRLISMRSNDSALQQGQLSDLGVQNNIVTFVRTDGVLSKLDFDKLTVEIDSVRFELFPEAEPGAATGS